MKVTNMYISKGNKVPNQFIIEGGNFRVFQSYDSVIAQIEYTGDDNYKHRDCREQTVTLDVNEWDSRTTDK